jgi:hypothetical protein
MRSLRFQGEITRFLLSKIFAIHELRLCLKFPPGRIFDLFCIARSVRIEHFQPNGHGFFEECVVRVFLAGSSRVSTTPPKKPDTIQA